MKEKEERLGGGGEGEGDEKKHINKSISRRTKQKGKGPFDAREMGEGWDTTPFFFFLVLSFCKWVVNAGKTGSSDEQRKK